MCVERPTLPHQLSLLFFFFNDTATTEIYTLSLHDALPIYCDLQRRQTAGRSAGRIDQRPRRDRKSTRLNSSHTDISYAVFCLKKKKNTSELQSNCYLAWCFLLIYNTLRCVTDKLCEEAPLHEVCRCCADLIFSFFF